MSTTLKLLTKRKKSVDEGSSSAGSSTASAGGSRTSLASSSTRSMEDFLLSEKLKELAMNDLVQQEQEETKSILVKFALKTENGEVDMAPVKFTLDENPSDGSNPRYRLDTTEEEDDDPLCISMVIDMTAQELAQKEAAATQKLRQKKPQ